MPEFGGDVVGDEQLIFGLGGLADIPGDQRRQYPQDRERQADQEGVVAWDRRQDKAEDGNRRRMPHLPVVVGGAALGARLDAGGGLPLQHQLPADEEAVERTAYRVRHQAGHVCDEDDAQRDLGIGGADFRPDGIEVGPGNDVPASREKAGDQRQRRRDEEQEDQEDLPDQRTERLEEVPAEDGGEEPGDRGQ